MHTISNTNNETKKSYCSVLRSEKIIYHVPFNMHIVIKSLSIIRRKITNYSYLHRYSQLIRTRKHLTYFMIYIFIMECVRARALVLTQVYYNIILYSRTRYITWPLSPEQNVLCWKNALFVLRVNIKDELIKRNDAKQKVPKLLFSLIT